MRKLLFHLLAATGILWALLSKAPAQEPVQLGPYYYNHQAATTTGVVLKAGPGLLHCVSINTPLATGVITLYDNTAASGTTIAIWTIAASPQPSVNCFDVGFGTGLTIKIATANEDVTVSFK